MIIITPTDGKACNVWINEGKITFTLSFASKSISATLKLEELESALKALACASLDLDKARKLMGAVAAVVEENGGKIDGGI